MISRSVLLLPGFVFLLQTGRSLVTLICAMFGKTGTVVPSEVIIGLFIGAKSMNMIMYICIYKCICMWLDRRCNTILLVY